MKKPLPLQVKRVPKTDTIGEVADIIGIPRESFRNSEGGRDLKKQLKKLERDATPENKPMAGEGPRWKKKNCRLEKQAATPAQALTHALEIELHHAKYTTNLISKQMPLVPLKEAAAVRKLIHKISHMYLCSIAEIFRALEKASG